MNAADFLVLEIFGELEAQRQKWGEQNHRSVEDRIECPELRCAAHGIATEMEAKEMCAVAKERHRQSFATIVVEELAEAVSCADDNERRQELVQLAACVFQWIMAIDRRRA